MNIQVHNLSAFDEQFNGFPIAHGVNCVGVMGSGFALELKERFPDHFLQYREACQAGVIRPGRCFPTIAPGMAWVYHLAIKDHWINHAKPDYLSASIFSMAKSMVELCGHTEIVMPAIGCGLGGLEYGQLISSLRACYPILTAHVCIPNGRQYDTFSKLLLP